MTIRTFVRNSGPIRFQLEERWRGKGPNETSCIVGRRRRKPAFRLID